MVAFKITIEGVICPRKLYALLVQFNYSSLHKLLLTNNNSQLYACHFNIYEIMFIMSLSQYASYYYENVF